MSEGKDEIEFTLLPIRGFPSHVFNGAEYQIFRNPQDDRGWGYTERHDVSDRLMWIQDRSFDVFLLMVLVHEALHACFDHRLEEEEVETIANDVAVFVGKFLLSTSDPARAANGLKPLRETDLPTLSREISEVAAKYLGESRCTSKVGEVVVPKPKPEAHP